MPPKEREKLSNKKKIKIKRHNTRQTHKDGDADA